MARHRTAGTAAAIGREARLDPLDLQQESRNFWAVRLQRGGVLESALWAFGTARAVQTCELLVSTATPCLFLAGRRAF